MPPAFNLSQDQTLQFNAFYCFLFLRIGPSLNVLTSSSHLPVARKTLKTYLNTSVRLDTFASRQHLPGNPEKHRHAQSQAPSAHTYRLLVFKEHSLPTVESQPSEPHRFRVAASAAQKRDYEESFSPCQQVCERLLSNLPILEAACFSSGPRCETRRRIIGDGTH